MCDTFTFLYGVSVCDWCDWFGCHMWGVFVIVLIKLFEGLCGVESVVWWWNRWVWSWALFRNCVASNLHVAVVVLWWVGCVFRRVSVGYLCRLCILLRFGVLCFIWFGVCYCLCWRWRETILWMCILGWGGWDLCVEIIVSLCLCFLMDAYK